MITNHTDILDWLDQHKIKRATIRGDNSVDVDGSVWLNSRHIVELPIQFGTVSGEFNITYAHLTTLRGCPRTVAKTFFCGHNSLTSLEYLPDIIGESLYVNDLHTFDVLRILLSSQIGRVDGLQPGVKDIINRHLESRDIFACQQELIEAGFEEYAQL